jgi:hypothetical protein
MNLIEAPEGMDVKESDDFPQGDKTIGRRSQAFLREFIFTIQNNKHKLLETIAKEKTLVRRLQVRVEAMGLGAFRGRWDAPSHSLERVRADRIRSDPQDGSSDCAVRRSGRRQQRELSSRGEIRGIIGPNGAGKSTFFNCLTGVLRPTSGRIEFNGEDIAGLPPRDPARRSRAPTRSPTSCRARPCSRTCGSPASPAITTGACCHHRAYTDVIARARAVLADVGLAGKEDELASNLRTASSATSRSASRSRRSRSSCASTSRRPG